MVVQSSTVPYTLESLANVTNLNNFLVQCNTDTTCPLPPQSLASTLQNLTMIGTSATSLAEIAKFTKLRTLRLTPYHSYAVGGLFDLDLLATLPELRCLDISLSVIPESLAKLTNLQELCVRI